MLPALDLEGGVRATAALLLGCLVTLGVAIASLAAGQPLQAVVYDALYLAVGPSEATEAATLALFVLAGVAGATAAVGLADAVTSRLAHARALIGVVGGLFGLVVLFGVLSLARLAAFPTALALLGLGLTVVVVWLWVGTDVEPEAVFALAGAIPAVLLLLVLAGFGIGWGWGYVMTAEEVPASTAPADPATFETVPEVGADLFSPAHCRAEAGSRVCRLELRGYEHETAAARFMAEYGVRCPYEASATGRDAGSFVARFGESTYRISCFPHGD